MRPGFLPPAPSPKFVILPPKIVILSEAKDLLLSLPLPVLLCTLLRIVILSGGNHSTTVIAAVEGSAFRPCHCPFVICVITA
jgi:hypothetical protein